MKSKVSSARKKEDEANVTFQQLTSTFFSGGPGRKLILLQFSCFLLQEAVHQKHEFPVTRIKRVKPL